MGAVFPIWCKVMAKENTFKIGDLIKKSLQSVGIAEKIEKQMAVAHWAEIVGEKLAEKTTAVKVEKDILKVKVVSAPWRNELVFFKEDILKKIAARIGDGKINDIYFM
jgi:predicted nucleic acid-binding Zn ribbon protein